MRLFVLDVKRKNLPLPLLWMHTVDRIWFLFFFTANDKCRCITLTSHCFPFLKSRNRLVRWKCIMAINLRNADVWNMWCNNISKYSFCSSSSTNDGFSTIISNNCMAIDKLRSFNFRLYVIISCEHILISFFFLFPFFIFVWIIRLPSSAYLQYVFFVAFRFEFHWLERTFYLLFSIFCKRHEIHRKEQASIVLWCSVYCMSSTKILMLAASSSHWITFHSL